MTQQPWRGIFVIVVTPFTAGYELDEASLRQQIRFCIEAGAHGLVGPANASEFATLSDDERKRWIEIVVSEAAGQIPVVAATTAGHSLPAVALSRWAQQIGADGVMAMPPHVLHPEPEGCYAYYAALSAALAIPICVQNFPSPIGTPMSSQLVGRLCRELPHVDYIKEETLPEPRQISATLAAAGAACKGIFGGQGGIYLLDEYRRGCHGNMPACQATDVHVAIWNKLEAGDEAAGPDLDLHVLAAPIAEPRHRDRTSRRRRRQGCAAARRQRGNARASRGPHGTDRSGPGGGFHLFDDRRGR
ncbi:MAG: dihydrodipicolinate synthase family protein [Nitrospiraceae bacterium]|nr:dihydrodipicolinate synthase family protein [Nitrospiraceae bacterium]